MHKTYHGSVQTDAFGAYARIAAEYPDIVLVGLWAHARRKFHDAAKAGKNTSAAREAVEYTLDQWELLNRYLKYAELAPDNNIAERQIRPFIVGRKN